MQVIGNNYWSAQIQKKEEGWQDYIVGMLSTNPQIHKSKRNPQIQMKEGWQDYIVGMLSTQRGFDVSADPRTFNGLWLDSRILSHFLKFQQREQIESEN